MVDLLNELAPAWQSVLTKLASGRQSVRCTKSNAWYRGHASPAYQLSPTILRLGARPETETSADVISLSRSIEEKKTRLQLLYAAVTKEGKALQSEWLSQNPGTLSISTAYRDARRQADVLKRDIATLRRRVVQLKSSVLAEQDIFDEYSHLSGSGPTRNSWSTLVEMRHHGVPTRLLDWSDRFDVALFFATRQIKQELEKNGVHDISRASASHIPLMQYIGHIHVWVMNPYALAKKVAGRFSIIDISRNPDLDYYSAMLVKRSWPFDLPLPIYPAFVNERVDAQKGFFTVHGNLKEPLEALVPKRGIAQRIEFTPSEALCAIYFLEVVLGLNEFFILRDKDSLGKVLLRKFCDTQLWTHGIS